jgi:hypothetical protein
MQKLIRLPDDAMLDELPISGYVKINMPKKNEKTRFALEQAKIQKQFPVKMVAEKVTQTDENGEPVLDENGEEVLVDGQVDENLHERIINQALALYDDVMPRIVEVKIKYDGVEYKDKTILDEYDDVYTLFQTEFATKVYGENRLGKKK